MAVATGIGAAIGGIGGLISGISNAKNSATAYSADINPYTGQTYNALQGYAGRAWNQLQSGTVPAYQGNLQALQSSMPGLMQMGSQIMGDYGENVYNTAALQQASNFRDVANQYGDIGATNSGAALSAMAKGAAEPYSEAMTNIANLQAQVNSGLVSNAWNGIQNLNQLYGNTLSSALSGMSGIANPSAWPQTSYVTGGGSFGDTLSGIGGLVSGLGGIDWGGSGSNSTFQNNVTGQNYSGFMY